VGGVVSPFVAAAGPVASRVTMVYLATTRDAARAVGRAGYTPGSAPGRYRYVTDRGVSRLSEIRGVTS